MVFIRDFDEILRNQSNQSIHGPWARQSVGLQISFILVDDREKKHNFNSLHLIWCPFGDVQSGNLVEFLNRGIKFNAVKSTFGSGQQKELRFAKTIIKLPFLNAWFYRVVVCIYVFIYVFRCVYLQN